MLNDDNKTPRSELRKSLNYIIIAITFGMAFFSVLGSPLGAPPFTGFIRTLGAGDLIYSIIMAMPVVGGVIQVFASYYMENTGNRKQMFLITGFIHRLLWIPIALIPLVIPMEHNNLQIWSITVLITISCAASSITGVTFLSWMGALIPMEIRGRFFSRRTMICTITSVIAGVTAGKLLDLMPGIKGFSIIFVCVALFGSIDILFFLWIKHPAIEVPEVKIPFLKLFKEPFKNKNYVRLITFVTLWNFGANFSMPFFNVYMIEYLNMSFFVMSLFTQFLSSLTTIFFIRFWGRLADRYGSKPVSHICCTIAFTLPLFWLFATPGNYYILLVMNFLAGICWPGLDMSNTNMSIWLAPEKNRSIYLANYSLITTTLGTALAFICGGAFMQFMRPVLSSMDLPFLMGQKLNSFHVLFIISSLIRLAAAYILLPRVQEPNSRPVKHIIFKTALPAEREPGM